MGKEKLTVRGTKYSEDEDEEEEEIQRQLALGLFPTNVAGVHLQQQCDPSESENRLSRIQSLKESASTSAAVEMDATAPSSPRPIRDCNV